LRDGLPVRKSQWTDYLRKAAERIPAQRLWINPDYGLETLGWKEVLSALANVVAPARTLRADVQV